MTGWLWIVAAWADPPDQLVELWPINTTAGLKVERMAVSEFGDLIVGRTQGDLKGWMLDVDSWTLLTFGGSAEGCEVTGVAPIWATIGDSSRWELWMSCGDGSIQALAYQDGALVDVVDDAGTAIRFDAVDETLSGLWYEPGAGILYAISAAVDSTDPAVVHAIDPYALTLDTAVYSGYPVFLTDTSFNEAVIVGTQLIVSHGGPSMSTLNLNQANASAIPDASGPSFKCDDLASTPLGLAYCVDSGIEGGLGSAYQYSPVTNQFLPLPLGTLQDPAAICVNDDLSDGWIAVTGYQVKVWNMDSDGTVPSSTPYFQGEEDADNPIQDMVTNAGYLYGGGTEGNLHVVTARPWIDPKSIQAVPVNLTGGQTALVTFTVREASSYKLFLGGDRTGSGGIEIASGEAAANEEISESLLVNEDYEEGNNNIYIIATSDETGLTGHGLVTLNVDNPPDPPVLIDGNVQFSDEALVLSFDGIEDADLREYKIYVSQEPFTAAQWPTGGPAFDGALKTPIVVPSSPSAHVTQRIAPLTNDVTYYIGVRAWDTGDKEGPMSKVVKGTPRKTYTAAELAGDPGGSPCSTGPRSASSMSLAGLGVAGLAAMRRIRRKPTGTSLLLFGGILGMLASAPASAQDSDDDPWWRQDMTPARANFEIRYGSIALADDRIDLVYRDNPHNLLQAEVGPQLFRYAEVDFGFGFFQELAKTTTGDGKLQSADVTMLTWFPLSLDVTGRAHILDEQPAVPFIRYGWDYILWSEKSDNGLGGKDIERGAKFGTHTSLGVDLLLDLLAPGRASFLEAQTGINDSWITVEWRRQRVDARSRPWSGRTNPPDRLDFSGEAIMVGLKLDW